MKRIFRLKNTIQPYAWGSHTALADLLGLPSPSADPQAELWMGAHPKASSKVRIQNRWQNLAEVIAKDPVFFLGSSIAQRFNNTFPFLFKVLAVEQPLSIQAHPNAVQAQRGFQRENDLGIPLDSVKRNYRDDRHKPECVCAVTPFWTLCGFRAPSDIVNTLDAIWPQRQVADLIHLKKAGDSDGLAVFLQNLLQQSQSAQQALVAHIVRKASTKAHADPIFECIIRLNQAFPGDVGCIAPAFLNLICLQPGEALFLPAGRLHAYLQGVAIEVMSNSDNVLRGGLTSKHLDAKELINILKFEWPPVKILSPIPINNIEAQYPGSVPEFALSVIKTGPDQIYSASNRTPGPEILLCIEGHALIDCSDVSESLSISKGESVLVTAGVPAYDLIGKGVIYKASATAQEN
jgi:mannose-6-phosphate isomerase